MSRVINVVQFRAKKARQIKRGDRFVAPAPLHLFVEVKEVSRHGRYMHLHCSVVKDPSFQLEVKLRQVLRVKTWHLIKGSWGSPRPKEHDRGEGP